MKAFLVLGFLAAAFKATPSPQSSPVLPHVQGVFPLVAGSGNCLDGVTPFGAVKICQDGSAVGASLQVIQDHPSGHSTQNVDRKFPGRLVKRSAQNSPVLPHVQGVFPLVAGSGNCLNGVTPFGAVKICQDGSAAGASLQVIQDHPSGHSTQNVDRKFPGRLVKRSTQTKRSAQSSPVLPHVQGTFPLAASGNCLDGVTPFGAVKICQDGSAGGASLQVIQDHPHGHSTHNLSRTYPGRLVKRSAQSSPVLPHVQGVHPLTASGNCLDGVTPYGAVKICQEGSVAGASLQVIQDHPHGHSTHNLQRTHG